MKKRILAFILAMTMTLTHIPALGLGQEPVQAAELEEFIAEDFTYDGDTITGFSQSGIEKVGSNKNLQIPDKSPDGTTIKSIGDGAFSSKTLDSVTFPSSLETVGNSAFSANKLKKLTLTRNITSIGEKAFSSNNISEIEFSPKLKHISKEAFKLNPELQFLEIPGTIKTIDDRAFEWTGIRKLNLREGVESIGEGSFTRSNLRELFIPSTLKSVADTAFTNNVEAENGKVKLITFNPESPLSDSSTYTVEYSEPIYNAGDFTYDGNSITGFNTRGEKKLVYNKHLIIPSKMFTGEDIKAIGKQAFAYKGLKEVTIPDTVTEVGMSAFASNQIEKVKLSKSMTVIGTGLFTNNNLESIGLHEGIVAIEASAFNGNPIRELVLPPSLASIGRMAFNQNQISELEIPASVKTIDASAFTQKKGQETLEKLVLNEGLESIGNYAFRYGKLASVDLPSSLQTLSENAFANNLPGVVKLITKNEAHLDFNNEKSLVNQEVLIGEAEEETNYSDSFDSEDFTYEGSTITGFSEKGLDKYTNQGIKDLVIPGTNLAGEKITAIADKAFMGTTRNKNLGNNLKSLSLSEGLESIGMQAFSNNNLTEVIIPDSVTSIGISAFANNDLKIIKLPEGLETIEGSAFQMNQLEEVFIPETVKSIGRFSFGSNKISQTKIPNGLEVLDYNAFSKNPDVVKLYTTNPNHPAIFNTDQSLKNQEVIYQAYNVEDFTYKESVLTGFSAQGLEKLADNKHVNLPDKNIEGQTIQSVGNRAFAGKGIETVIIPEGIESLGEGAFLVNNLRDLNLPLSMKKIDKLAFGKNENLVAIKLNEGLEYLGQQAFFDCKALSQEVEIPSSLTTLMTSSFNESGVTEIFIKGDENSADLNIKSGINKALTKISFESPYKKAQFHFNTFGCNAKTNTVDLGRVDVEAKSQRDLEKWIGKNINLIGGGSYTHDRIVDGLNDIFLEMPIDWDLSNFSYDLEFEIRGILNKDIEIPPISGYGSPVPGNCNAIVEIVLKVKATKAENPWKDQDFLYGEFNFKPTDGLEKTVFGITGLTDAGKEKLSKHPDLIIPETINLDGIDRPVEAIGKSAFENVKIESVTLPETKGKVNFVIEDNAFKNSGLEEVTLSEGLRYIEESAFENNKLAMVEIPSTVLKIGNRAFMDNEIYELIISDFVSDIALDNNSFANNKLTKVSLPFSVFKIQDYVFRDNPGQVILETMNEAHLLYGTYIVTESDHHKIVKTTDIDRSGLWEQIKEAESMDLQDFEEEPVKIFLNVLYQVQEVFADRTASQDQIVQAKDRLIEAKASLRASAPAKSELRDLVSRAQELEERLFTEDSYASFKEALNQAEEVLAKPSTEEEIQEAKANLQEAMDKLIIAETALYKSLDFTYDGDVIIGFSESGKEKFVYNKNLVLPDANPDGREIREIGAKAFSSDSLGIQIIFGTDDVASPDGIQSLVLPKYLKTVGNEAFRYNNIKALDLPETLETIGNMAFNGNQIEKLDLPNSVKTLGYGAFSLNQIKELSLSEDMKETGEGAFARNIRLKKINLAEGLEKISKASFWGAPIESIDIPSTVKEIGENAFTAHRLEKLTIPANVQIIGESAFEQNPKWIRLKELTLGEGIREIGEKAFKNSVLTQVDLPESLEVLGKNAFEGNIDDHKNERTVKLYTINKDHLNFDLDKFAEIILKDHPVDLLEKAIEAIKDKEDLSGDELKDILASYEALSDKHKDQVAEDKLKNLNEAIVEFANIQEDKANFLEIIEDKTDMEVEEGDKTAQVTVDAEFDSFIAVIFEGEVLGRENYDVVEGSIQVTFKEAFLKGLKAGTYKVSILTTMGLANTELEIEASLPEVTNPEKPSKPSKPNKPGTTIKPIDPIKPDDTKTEDTQTDKTDEKDKNQTLDVQTTRTAGDNRYQTAIEISKQTYDKVETVILASGLNYPDALAASALASKEKAPILLLGDTYLEGISQDSLAVFDEIQRLGAKEVIIVGGTNIIHESYESLLGEERLVRRIAGEDRYETAALIAEEVLGANPDIDTVILADGRNYPDALAIGAYAAKECLPIILTKGDEIPQGQDLLEKYKIDRAIIVGGENSVGKVEEYFEKNERIAGKDRYETAVKVAERFFPEAKEIALANGENYPDALALSPWAGKNNMPVLLTRQAKLEDSLRTYIQDKGIEKIHIFGGNASVSEDVFK